MGNEKWETRKWKWNANPVRVTTNERACLLKGLGRNRICTLSQEGKKKTMKAFMSAGTTRSSPQTGTNQPQAGCTHLKLHILQMCPSTGFAVDTIHYWAPLCELQLDPLRLLLHRLIPRGIASHEFATILIFEFKTRHAYATRTVKGPAP